MLSKVITISQQKGGTGKTTLAVHLAMAFIKYHNLKVAVIDTGVDFNHPDLLGWGPDGKVIGGYNFIQTNQLPMDKNGHGTKVAGIIAADGSILGIAPKAKILAYKVSEDGEGVSSELISGAIKLEVMLLYVAPTVND